MRAWKIWAGRLAAVAAALLLYFLVPPLRGQVDQAARLLAGGELAPVRDYLRGFGWWGPLVSILLMVLQALALPLPAFLITFANAWLYGWAWGALLSWSGAMLAAMICYGLARWFGRPLVERLVGRTALAAADGFFHRCGPQAVLVARLVPVVSFDLVSYAAGLTSIGPWTLCWATGLGQLPATIVYSYLGDSLGAGAQKFLWGLALAFLLVLAGWVTRARLSSPRTPARRGKGEP